MMALTFATIPTIITRVRLLVAIIILVSVVVVGLVLWQSQVHDKMNDVTLNYHAATSQHISSLQNELHTIRDHLEKLSNQDSFSIRYNDLILPNTGLTPSLHIINQNMQQIISLQKNYQNPIFAILINQLRQKLLPYQSLIDSAMAQDRINYEINITRIDAALLTLKQYKRLHNKIGRAHV